MRHLLDLLLARARVPRHGQGRPGPLPPERHAAAPRRSEPAARRSRLDRGDSARADARRSARYTGSNRGRTLMKSPRTGGTGYLGRAVVRALAARGHELVVFARTAGRSGLPGHADRRRRPGSRGARTRRRRLRRRLAFRRARQHLAPPARRLRRRQRRRAAQRAGGRPRPSDSARPLHLVVRRAAAARPHRADRGERLPADEGGGGSRWPTKRCATARRSSASIPAWSTGRDRSPKATSSAG